MSDGWYDAAEIIMQFLNTKTPGTLWVTQSLANKHPE